MAKAATHNALRRVAAPEIEMFPDVVQRSDEWFALRQGLPTASCFDLVMAEGDGVSRKRYMRVLAGELITGRGGFSFRNEDTDRGIALEPEVREDYGRSRFCSLAAMGFVRRRLPSGRFAGCSPDSFVDADGVLEIKTHRDDIMVDVLDRGAPGFPKEHRAQCQGTLWVTGRAWCDLILYSHPAMPRASFRIERDESYIQRLSDAIEVFDYDLWKLVSKIRSMAP
jgi:YqaJ-like viral recombinase domain